MHSFKTSAKASFNTLSGHVKPMAKKALGSVKQIQCSKRFIGITTLSAVMVLGGGFILFSKNKASAQKPSLSTVQFNIEHNTLSALGQTLNGVSSSIAAIEKELQAGKGSSNIDVAKLSQQLKTIEGKVNGATAASTSALSNEITHSTNALKAQLVSINQRLKSIQSKKSDIKQLPVSALSFKVLYIESIQGNAVVTLGYNHTTFPLMVGERFQGFRLSGADYAKQMALFTNNKHQEVVVRLSSVQAQGVTNG